MSDALPLPLRPNLEQYKKLAKDFQDACSSEERGAIRDWAVRWAETLARLQGHAITPEVRQEIHRNAERVQRQWHTIRKSKERVARCSVTDAQFFVARCHGFASWPRFAKHVDTLALANSPVSNFEAAVDAIVSGDTGTLAKLLHDHPELVRARSTREHRSTLLHYVSANGVEDFRQKTPKNILDITKLLLNAGADVNAESDAYGGRSTTLGLTATSWHPEHAGVQLPLMELLINHGAIIDGPDGGSAVNGCLHNGRGEAAEFFASRGARLDLEGAAGVGRLDVVKSFFNDDGGLKPTATEQQVKDGFAWACEFGRTSVVEFLLEKNPANYSDPPFPTITMIAPARATIINDLPLRINWRYNRRLSDSDQSLVKKNPGPAPKLTVSSIQYLGKAKGGFIALVNGQDLSELAEVRLNGVPCDKPPAILSDSVAQINCRIAPEADWEFTALTSDPDAKKRVAISVPMPNPQVILLTGSQELDGTQYGDDLHPSLVTVQLTGSGFTPRTVLAAGQPDRTRFTLTYISPTSLRSVIRKPQPVETIIVSDQERVGTAAILVQRPADKKQDGPAPQSTITTTMQTEKKVVKN